MRHDLVGVKFETRPPKPRRNATAERKIVEGRLRPLSLRPCERLFWGQHAVLPLLPKFIDRRPFRMLKRKLIRALPARVGDRVVQ
jgi:hypothetical protein